MLLFPITTVGKSACLARRVLLMMHKAALNGVSSLPAAERNTQSDIQHAYAGGFALALAHDFRVLKAGPGKGGNALLCLNEVRFTK